MPKTNISKADFDEFLEYLGAKRAAETNARQPRADEFRIDLTVFDNCADTLLGKVRLRLHKGDRELFYAYAKITSEGDFGVIQAISYAAHMLYKLAEQRRLGETDDEGDDDDDDC